MRVLRALAPQVKRAAGAVRRQGSELGPARAVRLQAATTRPARAEMPLATQAATPGKAEQREALWEARPTALEARRAAARARAAMRAEARIRLARETVLAVRGRLVQAEQAHRPF
jgi:hypothetical protein